MGKRNDAALIAGLREPAGTPEGAWKSAGLLRPTLDALAVAYRVGQSFRHTDPASMQAGSAESSAACTRGGFDGGHIFPRPKESPFLASFVCCLAQTTAGGAHAAAALA
ncbi:hypothetical protein [Acidovorax sp. SUPP2539]|uniref:hypothetical protein n=1 Tax=Acidovorax sp. SUPP2539 TaxID=2920878 RepID=UPI0023DE4FF4|nr:hypothetical protein [Acidovorax sp. SUPP2539]GKS88266.1 hypothetical protein AVTE2539_02895 [Acidovorax sp. SUPP2539]